ncbi:Tad domain-containing protein [Arthrobacter sp. TMN-37]
MHDERGGASVLLALLLVTLLGFAALVVDVGIMYSERAQLQNSADAAALGIAQKCAKNVTDPLCSQASGTVANSLADDLTNDNASDGRSNVQSVMVDTSARKVTVTTGAEEIGGPPNTVSLAFANIFGISSAEVGARSSVTWGSPKSGPIAFPIAVSRCEVDGHVGGGLQLLQNHGPSYTGPDSCPGSSGSGSVIPGGFAWLPQSSGSCGAMITINTTNTGTAGSAPGNSAPANCDGVFTKWENDILAGNPPVVFLPVFKSVSGTGNNGSYVLESFAAFKVAGWKFTGNEEFHNEFPDVPAAVACSDNGCFGIIGEFVKYVSLAEGYTLGPTDPHGATIIKMTID